MSTTPITTTHTTVDRLHALCRDLGSEQLTLNNLVEVLGMKRGSVAHLITGNEIEHSKCAAHHRGQDALGRKVRHRYTIEAAAVLTYLVKQTGGDKAVLMEAIRLRFPHHHPLCLRIAQGLPADPLPALDEPTATVPAPEFSTLPLPDNVVHIDEGRAPKPKKAKKAGPALIQTIMFPDFFSRTA